LGVSSPVAPAPTPTGGNALPGLVQPTAEAPFPARARASGSGISWLQWLFIGGGAIAGLAVIALLVSGLLLTGALGPVTSSDGVFSVKVPKGWVEGNAPTLANAKPVLGLAKIERTNGVESHFLVEDFGQPVPLATLEAAWQPFIESGKFPELGNFGALRRTAVAGAPALIVDYQGSKYGGQLLILDYGSKTYLIEMSSDPTEFNRLRDGDFAAILSSWQWR
jgi:hypothetical protein